MEKRGIERLYSCDELGFELLKKQVETGRLRREHI